MTRAQMSRPPRIASLGITLWSTTMNVGSDDGLATMAAEFGLERIRDRPEAL